MVVEPEPEVAAVEPEPVVAEPEPAVVVEPEPEPVVVEPEPEPEPAPEPVVVEPEPEPAPEPAPEPEPADVEAAGETETAAIAAEPARPAGVLSGVEATTQDGGAAPTLDIVRIESDGSTVIAGRAPAGSDVDIRIDGVVVATATATAKGEFVAFVAASTEAGAQEIQAVGTAESGEELVSADTVLILTPQAPEGETAAPAIVSASAEAITVLQTGGLAVPDQISLDSISYDETGEAVLAGRGQPLGEARVYVDGVFATKGAISDSGAWSVTLNTVEAGRYVLRVDEVAADGRVTSRVETPFQKEFPENVAPLLKMANGKLTVQPGNTLWVMAREIYGSGVEYTQIFQANRDTIRDPDLIYPGQIFSIPEAAPQ